MHTIAKAVLALGLFTCLVMSTVQAMSIPPLPVCLHRPGVCINYTCNGECVSVRSSCACRRL